MRVGVVGCGSIGLRHIRNLLALGVDTVLATDPDQVRLDLAQRAGATACADLDALLDGGPDAVLVCTPPASHGAIGLRTLQAGVHLFVEKPIALTLHEADLLIDASTRSRLVLQVGYNLRFHRAIRRLRELLDDRVVGRVLTARVEFGQYLPDWRPGSDYRRGYNASAALGGGVLLDGSHEIDYLRSLVGDFVSVAAVLGRVGDLDVDVEDVACLLLRGTGGIVVEVHLDSLQRRYSRGCKIVGTEGTLVWEYERGVRVDRGDAVEPVVDAVVPDPNDMYRDEVAHFLRSATDNVSSLESGLDGRRALEIVLSAKRAAAERREIPL